jgi:GDPmannose 4,6-dehydratase
MPNALITGVNGQDGSYLAELLLSKGYRVVGTVVDENADNRRILHIREKFEIVETDLLDQGPMEEILGQYEPDEIYNLAARASSRELWAEPVVTGEVNGLSVARWLEAIAKVRPKARFVQASSSEVFGNAAVVPQTEATTLHPRNPYGVAKAYGHWTTAIYREHQGLFACSAILYNHESPRRGVEFVTRKISRTVAEIKLGRATELRLGNLDSKRDWGFAGDYVVAMWLMLQRPAPDDYIVATGESHSVREFCEIAFAHVGLHYQDYVVQSDENFRSSEATLLVGNPAKAKHFLNWKPTVTFRGLVQMMVDSDLLSSQVVDNDVPQSAERVEY